MASLPRTEEGTAVLYFRQYNARLYCIESIVSIAPMVIDSVIYDERYDDPPTGLTVIWDMRGVCIDLLRLKISLYFRDSERIIGIEVSSKRTVIQLYHAYDSKKYINAVFQYSLAHLMKCRYTPVRALLQYVQYGLPLKLKSVHIVNAPSFVDKVLAFFKPFLKQSVFELVSI